MIEINNLTKTKIPLKRIKIFIRKTMGILKIKKNISLVFVGQARIKKLNKIYRGKNRTTDILSFPNFCEKDDLSGTNNFLGEIIISLPTAKEQAERAKHSLEKEIKMLVAHGFLHLLGFDHQQEKDKKKMEKMEKRLLNFGLV